MQTAIFGISNDGLNLAVNLFILFLVVVYIASVAFTYLDARRRVEDPVLVACATVAAMIPFIGAIIYLMLRPPEFLEDSRERELEMKAAELRVRQLSELSCPNCGFAVEKNYLRCPNCQRRLKDPCHSCGKPVDPRWALCPYCETALPGRQRQARPERRSGGPPRAERPEPKTEAEPRPSRRAPRPSADGAETGRRPQQAPARDRQRAAASRESGSERPGGAKSG